MQTWSFVWPNQEFSFFKRRNCGFFIPIYKELLHVPIFDGTAAVFCLLPVVVLLLLAASSLHHQQPGITLEALLEHLLKQVPLQDSKIRSFGTHVAACDRLKS